MRGASNNPLVLLDRSTRNDDSSWAERSAYWLKKSAPKPRRFMQRAGVRLPLILSGHGVRLRVDHGSLLVQDGFTHYPQQRETWRFFPGEWRLPSRIVLLDADGGLTFDALAWLSRHDVPLVQLNWRGEVTNVVGAAKATDPKLAKWQHSAQKKSDALQIAKELIHHKIANSVETLVSQHKSAATDIAIDKLRSELQALKRRPPSTINNLLGIEGRVGLAYFSALRTYPVRWRGIDRRPIPDDWHTFGRRASKVGDMYHPNRNAVHPIQAMLNYAYGILENQVRMQVVAAGLDPKIGIFHGSYKNKDGLVYDLMEPLRPNIDRKVMGFVNTNTFRPGDFAIRGDGVCRLNPSMARTLVQMLVSGSNSWALKHILISRVGT
jgi:CRISP-associated protein Cas1